MRLTVTFWFLISLLVRYCMELHQIICIYIFSIWHTQTYVSKAGLYMLDKGTYEILVRLAILLTLAKKLSIFVLIKLLEYSILMTKPAYTLFDFTQNSKLFRSLRVISTNKGDDLVIVYALLAFAYLLATTTTKTQKC